MANDGRNLLRLKKNDTGLPDRLKAGVEAISGYSTDDVKVHYNSSKPAQLQALAYAQGTRYTHRTGAGAAPATRSLACNAAETGTGEGDDTDEEGN